MLPGFAGEVPGRRRRVFGVGTGAPGVVEHAEDLITRFVQRHARPDSLDDAGRVPAKDERRGTQVKTCRAVQPIGRVDAGGADSN